MNNFIAEYLMAVLFFNLHGERLALLIRIYRKRHRLIIILYFCGIEAIVVTCRR